MLVRWHAMATGHQRNTVGLTERIRRHLVPDSAISPDMYSGRVTDGSIQDILRGYVAPQVAVRP